MLFTFAVLTAIAFGIRAGLIAAAISMGIIAFTGVVVITGKVTFHFDINEIPATPEGVTENICLSTGVLSNLFIQL